MAREPGKFFEDIKPASVYKLKILDSYAAPFAAMAGGVTGSVTFLDGYAGKGKYDDADDGDDGSLGSPLLLLGAAQLLALARNVNLFLVEQDPGMFAKLQENVRSHAGDEAPVTLRHGSIDEHLDECLLAAQNSALFAFLDPFGSAIAFDRVVSILKRPSTAPTEVLMLWTVSGVRRCGGQIRNGTTNAATLQRFDRFLGGSWWHEMFPDAETEVHEAAMAVAKEYCRRMSVASGTRSWFIVPVRDKPEHKPKYLLVFFTEHREGVWKFADALSYAHEAWVQKLHDDAERRRVELALREHELGVRTLFGALSGDDAPPAPVPFDLKAHKAAARAALVPQIVENIETQLRSSGPFRPVNCPQEVYGQTLGEAREMHVREAIKALHKAGRITNTGAGRTFYREILRPVPPAT